MSKSAWKLKFVQLTLGVVASGLAAEVAMADLYVVRVGDGSATLSPAATAAFVEKFADGGGSAVSTIAMPTAASGANFPLTTSGSATGEGYLSLSGNGQYLLMGGYNAVPLVSGIASTTSPAVSRVVGRIELATSAVDTTTSFTDTSFSGGAMRSVASDDGVKLWMAGSGSPGANAGVRYTTLGATTSTQLTSAPTNVRVAKIFNGQLYLSSASTTYFGVSSTGVGLPTEAGQTSTLIASTGAASSSYDFWFKDADTLYVAGDASAANGGGIQKWTQSGGTWTQQYILLNTGAATTGVRGLSGTVDGSGNAVLYGTTTATSANQLISVVDTGATATATTLATAAANTAFRGVVFVGSVAPPANNADFNGDNVVDGKDFLVWQRGFGLTGQPNKSTGDANGDGNVNAADLTIWKSKFGGPPAEVAVGAVPEPATLGMLGIALAAFAGVRRRAK
ncbi:dockerin type I domain-containing protein [Lacipirellula sp.]|uniref:dockerin type I domain-containing protein n=1 Tax=Lacipirellula sp. TaxID=2691419 RepID=UPI003D099488